MPTKPKDETPLNQQANGTERPEPIPEKQPELPPPKREQTVTAKSVDEATVKAAPKKKDTAVNKAKPAGTGKAKPGNKAKAAPKQKKKKQPKQKTPKFDGVATKIGRNPVGHAIGQALYQLGFYVECKVVLVLRALRTAFRFLRQVFIWLFAGVFRSFGGYVKSLWQDVTAPFRRFHSGMRNIRGVMREEKSKGAEGEVRKRALGYFGSGVKAYLHLVGNLVKFVLPIAAAGIFVFTVYTVLNLNYCLAVVVNGEIVGYIPDQATFEDARVMLRQRIVAADGRSAEEWQIMPEFAVATSLELTPKTQLVNNILTSQDPDEDDSLIEAMGVSINNELLFVTTEGERLDRFLQQMLDAQYDPADPAAEIDFVQQIEYELGTDDVFYSSSVWNIDDLEALLSSVVAEQETHTANGSENLLEIAHNHGLSLTYLVSYNKEYMLSLVDETLDDIEGDEVPAAGTVLVTRPQQNYLQVSKTYVDYRDIEFDYPTEYYETDTIVLGRTRVMEQGQNGLKRVYYYVEVIDGIEYEYYADDIPEEVLREAVPEVVAVGTLEISSSGSGVFGDYIFPLPDAAYSTRQYSGTHRAWDLNAPEGTPIYAANGGVVLEADWHWSYGNYVLIEHPDGLQTRYAHCISLTVSEGDLVDAGTLIGLVGSTGSSTGNHLHFEVVIDGVLVDPTGYVPWGL